MQGSIINENKDLIEGDFALKLDLPFRVISYEEYMPEDTSTAAPTLLEFELFDVLITDYISNWANGTKCFNYPNTDYTPSFLIIKPSLWQVGAVDSATSMSSAYQNIYEFQAVQFGSANNLHREIWISPYYSFKIENNNIAEVTRHSKIRCILIRIK